VYIYLLSHDKLVVSNNKDPIMPYISLRGGGRRRRRRYVIYIIIG
jgi:hypothetical protein